MMAKKAPKVIPIIDQFAGPGGLGEGFPAFRDADGGRPFRVALSIEKDPYAHRTLTLRSFFRQLDPGAAPEAYYEYLRKADEPETARRKLLFDKYPKAASRAEASSLLTELGRVDDLPIRERIPHALAKS